MRVFAVNHNNSKQFTHTYVATLGIQVQYYIGMLFSSPDRHCDILE